MMSLQTLLVIDDDAEIRALLTEYFTRAGFAVVALPDGAKLLETLRQQATDLIILDEMLPARTGLPCATRYATCRGGRSSC